MSRTLDGIKKLLGTDGDSIGDLFDNASNVITFTNDGGTAKASVPFETALKLHQNGRNLVAYYKLSDEVQAVSAIYIYTNGKFTFLISGIVQGSIDFSANGVVINMD